MDTVNGFLEGRRRNCKKGKRDRGKTLAAKSCKYFSHISQTAEKMVKKICIPSIVLQKRESTGGSNHAGLQKMLFLFLFFGQHL